MADRWLATIDVEHSTRVSYEASLKRYWCRRFGETIIDEIRNSEIKEVLAPLNAKTKNNTLIPMRGVLRDRVLQRHVTVGADRGRMERLRPQRRPATHPPDARLGS